MGSLPKRQNANELIPQSTEVTVLIVLCIMLKQSFVFFPLWYWGILWKINRSGFQYSLELPLDTILCFLLYYFHSHLHPLYNFSGPHAPTLISGISVRAGLRQNTQRLEQHSFPLVALAAQSLGRIKFRIQELAPSSEPFRTLSRCFERHSQASSFSGEGR